MKICPVCGNEIVVDTKTGCLLIHGPENKLFDSPSLCSGSGMEVQLPQIEEEEVII